VGRELVTPLFENIKGARRVTQDKVLRGAKIVLNNNVSLPHI
jgi:hypothetical protein